MVRGRKEGRGGHEEREKDRWSATDRERDREGERDLPSSSLRV